MGDQLKGWTPRRRPGELRGHYGGSAPVVVNQSAPSKPTAPFNYIYSILMNLYQVVYYTWIPSPSTPSPSFSSTTTTTSSSSSSFPPLPQHYLLNINYVEWTPASSNICRGAGGGGCNGGNSSDLRSIIQMNHRIILISIRYSAQKFRIDTTTTTPTPTPTTKKKLYLKN